MRPSVAVLDHGMGNLPSVTKALEAAGAAVTLVRSPSPSGFDGLCVPGQGIFGRCMDALDGAWERAIASWIDEDRPYLGICLGMQVLFEGSEESGGRAGLGVLAGTVSRLPDGVRVPHIGWNTVESDFFYFDHSYAAQPRDPSVVTGWCEHGERFAARVESARLLGVQFHPEKSGAAGIGLLRGWVGSL